MRKLNGFQKDIIITGIVFIFVTISLAIINYQNISYKNFASVKQIPTDITVLEEQSSEQIYVFKNLSEVKNIFPEFSDNVDWDKNNLIAYIGLPQPNPGYHLQLQQAKRESNYLNITYKTIPPASESSNISVISYPVLFATIDKDDLTAGSDLYIQFIESQTRHTQSLKIPSNEI